jgi:predicted AlkP superfamily pyrophosphatase or phosphodiesterase
MTRRSVSAIAICAVAMTWQVRSLKSEVSGARTSDLVLQTSTAPPRLVVLIVIDQMRADYFQRYADRFTDGFKRLWDSGAVFTQARYPYASNKTAQAHALMVSGSSPSASGIVGDRWLERSTGSMVAAGASATHKVVGTGAAGGSPEQLRVSTVGDALKAAHPSSMVLAASWKRYTAILNAGQHPDAAYWLDEASGRMVTSDYYMRAYPAWTAPFTQTDLTAPLFGTTWQGHHLGVGVQPDEPFRYRVRYSPHGNSILLSFAKAIVERSGVGADADPDFVAISFSSLDFVGHEYGPETPEFDETLQKLDRDVGELLRTLDAKIGPTNYAVAFTADHGVALVPEKQQARGIDAGAISTLGFRAAVDAAVSAKLGIRGPITSGMEPPELYLNYPSAASQNVSREALDRAVVEAAQAQPGIARAFTVADLARAAGSGDPILEAVADGYYAERSGDLHILVKPNYIFWSGGGTTHGSPYDYDAHVPLIFMGVGVKPGRYDQRIRVNELAPTLGHLLGVAFKGDAKGRVLLEALQP